MDRDLEQAILRALNESLSGKSPDPINEAQGDWVTTQQVIAKIRAFSPDQNPLVNLRAYTLSTSGERKNYSSLIKGHVSSNYFEKYKRDHFAAIQGKASKRKILTRERLAEILSGEVPLPSDLRKKWDDEYRDDLAGIEREIQRKLSLLYSELASHSTECTRYAQGKCIRGTKLDNAYRRSGAGSADPLYDVVSVNPTELVKELHNAIKLADRGDMRLVQCSPTGAVSLTNVAEVIESRKDSEGDYDLADLVALKNNLSAMHLNRPLTDEDFEYLKDNARIGAALMRADEVEIKPPLVAARTSKLEHQIIWQIINSSGKRKFDKDTDLCAEMLPVIQGIIEKHDYDDETGFFQIHIARQLSSLYGYDKVQEAFENVLGNWDEQCREFLEVTRPQYTVSHDGNDIAGINPTYAVPGSEDHIDWRDTGQVPRISNDEGVGIGGEYGADQPTVYDVYNDFVADKRSKEYGFGENFTWFVIFGTEESSIRNTKGECPICDGSGYISPDTISVPTDGDVIGAYWDVVLGEQDTEQAGGQRCARCEGSGKIYPIAWQHAGNESGLTPFEIVFQEVWDLLTSLGYEPKAYDGFVTDSNELVDSEHGGFPIPAPRRPEVETQYSHNREGESNTLSYTTIIRLDNPMGVGREEVGANFQTDFYKALQQVLTSRRMPVDLTPVAPDADEQEALVYSLRREPRWTVKRWARERTDAKGVGSAEDAVRVSDIEEFEAEYLKIVNEGIGYVVPSYQLSQELEKLLSVARELDVYKAYDITVPIYAFLEMDREEYQNRRRLINGYDNYVEIGQKSSYGDLIEYCLKKLKARERDIKSYERYEGVLQLLLAKAHLYNVEIPGGDETSLDRATDINEELKLYIKHKNRIERIQRKALFKPGTRGDDKLVIKGIEDITAIARRINAVFEASSELHPQTDIPIDSKSNPVFHLLVPLGWENTAEEIAGIDDMKLVEMLITGGAGGFDPVKEFESTKGRRALARYYWKAQIEDKPLLDVLKDGMGDHLPVREMFPNYGLTHDMVKRFENNNSSVPEQALTSMFAEGVRLAEQLYRKNPEQAKEIYAKDKRVKATPEGDLKKLNTFLKAARYRLVDPSVKARMNREARSTRDHLPEVESAQRELRENQEWLSHYNDLIADFLGLDLEDVDEDEQNAFIETEIFVSLKHLVAGAAQVVPQYSQYAQLAERYPATFMRQIAPIFEPWLAQKGVRVDLQNLLYPGLDAEGEIDDIDDLLNTLKIRMNLRREGGKMKIGNRAEMRKFFQSLLRNAKNTTEVEPDAGT